MENPDEHFLKKLKAIFEIEAHEQLQKIANGLLEIENSTEPLIKQDLIDSLFREAHNLKGSARAVSNNVIQNICQSLESALSSLRAERIKPDKDFFSRAYAAIDLIQKYVAFEGATAAPEDAANIDKVINYLDLFAKKSPKKPSEQILTNIKLTETAPESSVLQAAEEDISHATIRVSTLKLNTLLQQIEETLMVKISAKQRSEELIHLLSDFAAIRKSNIILRKKIFQLDNILKNSENKNLIPVDRGLLHDLSEMTSSLMNHYQTNLESIYKLSTQAVQDNHVSESIIDSLFENTKKVLMHPFGSILESFPRMARDIAETLGKNVQLNIEGKSIEIDKRILEEIKDPLVHLLRNAIDHGVESPEVRVSRNKPVKGTVTISASQSSGSYVEITVGDDGGGIDIDKLKEKALHHKVMTKNELDEINEDNLNIHLFQPGLSTKEVITDISGRGVGLDVVREKVEKLKGSISIQSKFQQGTKFTIKLPLALATFRGLHINVQERDFIIPSHHMRKVFRISLNDLNTIEGRQMLLFADRHIPFYHLSSILNIPASIDFSERKHVNIVVIEASGVKIALGVDQIFNEQEIFVKPLGKQLKRVKFIYAATIMEWGKVIPILDPFDIIKSAGKTPSADSLFKPPLDTPEKKYRILVVEDNMTSRALIRNILIGAGYIVETAVDGLDAYTILQKNSYDLVISDIQMPHMDGYELTQKIKANKTLKGIPVILCSSLSSDVDRQKGKEAGADAYITKGTFSQSNLLKTIKDIIKG